MIFPLVAGLSLAVSLCFWLLSNPQLLLPNHIPDLLLAWSPLIGLSLIIYQYYAFKRSRRLLILGLSLLSLTLYAFWRGQTITSIHADQYLLLAILHLPLISWAISALSLANWPLSSRDKTAFFQKSFVLFIILGLFMGLVGLFSGLTMALFSTLNIQVPEPIFRFILLGGAGLFPLSVILLNYQPSKPPAQQDFSTSLDKLVNLLARVSLPFTLMVLVIYVALIPFHFFEPFNNRNLLINYNVVLIAVIALIILNCLSFIDLPKKYQPFFHVGLIVIAILGLIIDLYAFSATLTRTIHSFLTPNRLAVLGWDILNALVFFNYLWTVLRSFKPKTSLLDQIFSRAFTWYALWAVFLILGLPFFFW
jgi:hypothetical protein